MLHERSQRKDKKGSRSATERQRLFTCCWLLGISACRWSRFAFFAAFPGGFRSWLGCRRRRGSTFSTCCSSSSPSCSPLLRLPCRPVARADRTDPASPQLRSAVLAFLLCFCCFSCLKTLPFCCASAVLAFRLAARLGCASSPPAAGCSSNLSPMPASNNSVSATAANTNDCGCSCEWQESAAHLQAQSQCEQRYLGLLAHVLVSAGWPRLWTLWLVAVPNLRIAATV